jgi:hypothetical protein
VGLLSHHWDQRDYPDYPGSILDWSLVASVEFTLQKIS